MSKYDGAGLTSH